jgi:hypothetical protein
MAAMAYVYVHLWCFTFPPLLALGTVLLQARTGEGESA